MTQIKNTYDDSDPEQKQGISRITKTDISNLRNNIDNSLLLEGIKKSFANHQENIRFKQKCEKLLTDFCRFRNDICCDINCVNNSFISPICTICLLEKFSIKYSIVDGNFFYHSESQPYIYLTNSDLAYMEDLFTPEDIIFGSPDVKNVYSNNPKRRIPTKEELTALISIHLEFLEKSGQLKNIPSNILFRKPYQIIACQLAKTFFDLYKATNIIALTYNWEEELQKGLSEFNRFLLQNFHITMDNLPEHHSNFLLTLGACRSQQIIPLQPFSKLKNTLEALSNGDPLTIKQLAVMLAKIFIGRKYLKELDHDKQLNHLTIIISDNPKYIRDFLIDILKYIPLPSNLDYGVGLRIAAREHPSKHFYHKQNDKYYHVTEHTSTFLCNKENISQLIKEKLLGNILNIDTSSTPIEKGTFSKLLTGTAIFCSGDNIFNDKLTYRSNAHYVKICETANDIHFKGDKLPYDTIICSGKLSTAHPYKLLDAYELFFLVTGFLNYGISLLGRDLLAEAKTYTKHSIPNQDDTISRFIEDYYIDTFDLKKASHSQKDDSNDFVDADDDMYPVYKKWFNTLYKDILVCNTTKFKKRLRTIYYKREFGEDLKCLSKADQQKELTHRYLKCNKGYHRGVSGLKFNETLFQKSLDESELINHTISENSAVFEKFFTEIIEKYSLYNK